MCDLTQARLKQLLDYDPETGVFTWRVNRGGAAKAGTRAGCPTPFYYRVIRIGGRSRREHSLAWLYVHGHWPADELDHINRVRDDNRIANLREVTHAENMQNTGPVDPELTRRERARRYGSSARNPVGRRWYPE
jgi:hypothetical protein